jgi:hypothetical protein
MYAHRIFVYAAVDVEDLESVSAPSLFFLFDLDFATPESDFVGENFCSD